MATVSEKSKANLNLWKPGQSGNPSGRPKRLPISDICRALADMPLPKLPAKVRRRLKEAGIDPAGNFGEALTRAQFFEALKGSTKAFKEIREAIEGKTPQRIELSGSITAIDATVRFVKSTAK